MSLTLDQGRKRLRIRLRFPLPAVLTDEGTILVHTLCFLHFSNVTKKKNNNKANKKSVYNRIEKKNVVTITEAFALMHR